MAKKTMQAITKENSYGRRMVPEYLIDKLEKAPAKLVASGSIKDLTTDEINNLQAGDIVVKTTGNQKHTYIVTYKEEGQGICLSYFDAGYSETVSFDYVDGEWVYNSTDIVNENLMEEIHDSNGNLRFVEGEGTPIAISGLTISDCKWSLSGTHLMVVISGTVSNGTTLGNGVDMATIDLPQWIFEKLVNSYSSYIEIKTNSFRASDLSVQNTSTAIGKGSTNVFIRNLGTITLTANRAFRTQFDILVDNE